MNDLKQLFKYIKPYKIQIIFISLLSIIYSILYVSAPKILAYATNRLSDKINVGIKYSDFEYILKILIICLIIYIVINVIQYFNSIIINKICNKISYNLRKDINIKLNRLEIKHFNNVQSGEIISRIGNDVDVISNNLEQIFSETVSSVICFIGVLIMMFSISKTMSFITIFLVPVQMFLMIIIMFKSQKYFNKKQEIIANIDNKILTSVSSHKLIKLNNKQKSNIRDFKIINDDLYDCSIKSDFLSSIILPIVSFVNNCSYIIISIFGGISIIKGNLRIGDIQAFLQYSKHLEENSETIGVLSTTFQNVYASIKHINEFLLLEEENDSGSIIPKQFKGKIEFKNVSFSYDKKKIIKNFSANINPGDTIAIVGHTGSGKTTLTNLLMRFYDNYSGEIFIDNIELKNIKKESLRQNIGIVEQNNFVFSDSVLNNILFDDKINQTKIQKLNSLNKKFNINDFIDYNLIIDEDYSNISNGEAQLVSIFRTLVNDYDIIILDEATSKIDTRTEILIQNLTNEIMKKKTTIIIAHRLSTIKNSNCIFVMDNGRLCEVGTHDELIQKNGKYKILYENSI